MPQWAGSSWYFLRYESPRDDAHAVNPEANRYWGQVDWYNGGMEHVTRHLIYSRFWNQFLYDIGVVKDEEPYIRRSAQGLILGADGEKMSKSRGNVVNPDDVVKQYGADVLRLFIMFIGDYEKPAPWSGEGIKGCTRFRPRFWGLQELLTDEADTSDLNLDALIKAVGDDYEACKFNTAIAKIMTALNTLYQRGKVTKKELNTLCILLYPVAPHVTSEMYEIINGGAKLDRAAFPAYDPKKLIEDEIEIPVQVMGRLRGRINIPKGASEEEVMKEVEKAGLLGGETPLKVIYVPDKIVNIVVRK